MANRFFLYETDFSKAQRDYLGNLISVFNRYSGVINIALKRDDLEKYGLFWFQTLSSNSTILFGSKKEISSGGLGIDENANLALLKSFAEALERYSLSYKDEKIIQKLKPNTLSDENLLLIDNSNARYSKELEYDFIKVSSLVDQLKTYYWPADKIYVGYDKSKTGYFSTSTGVSLHTVQEQAIMSALLEIVERDTFVINHYLHPTYIQISPDSINIPLVEKILRGGFSARIYSLYNHSVIPVVLTILTNSASDSIYGIGCCASFSFEEAIKKSVSEAMFTYNYSKHLLHLRQSNALKIASLYEHFLYYHGDNLKFLLNHYDRCDQTNLSKLKKDNLSDNLKTLLSTISTSFKEILFADITPKDLASLGLVTVRVIIPGALDIHTRESYLDASNKRLESARKEMHRLGYTPLSKGLASIPHPMP